MKRNTIGKAITVLSLAALGSLVPGLLRPAATGKKPPERSPRILKTQFSYTAEVSEIPAGINVLDVWLPIPSDTAMQKITGLKVDSSQPYRITQEKKHGNRMVYFRIENPKKSFSSVVTFTIERFKPENSSENHNGVHPEGYLKADSRVPVGGRFLSLAQEIIKDKTDPMEKMRAIFDNTVATMQYDYNKESPRLGEGDVAFVCDYRKGNCSDLHSYLISLARSVGIPAFLEYGFPIVGIPFSDTIPTEGKIAGYHCWTWFYISGKGWIPLDASDSRRWLDAKKADIAEKLFGDLVLERTAVAFSKGRDIILEPPQKNAPLNYFIYPYAEADGKSVKASWELSYKILSNGKH
ncbi:MAG TPA: transglutaminase domain-containing protein [Fimbriimonadales bacterium]|nr:transglutaminase domain-containing protein [Fimbriimonadales bacterium]